MRNRAHWNSEKEYREFWSQSKSSVNSYNNKNPKKHLLVFCIVVSIIICLILTSLFFWRSGKVQSFTQTEETSIPVYTGTDTVILNDNIPDFTEEDYKNVTGESYSKLDKLGRCGTAIAMLHQSLMPTEERGFIGQIKPSGWMQKKYPGIVSSDPPYLYNRCHLIAYALTGQNDNELNLITGTRYMNATLMMPWEESIMEYLDSSTNHVLYRVTPHFNGEELLARGVEMEAYSVEDGGEGICFHVFIYNVQPGIIIDYDTGDSHEE